MAGFVLLRALQQFLFSCSCPSTSSNMLSASNFWSVQMSKIVWQCSSRSSAA